MAKARVAKIKRKTRETDIQVNLNIDGQGKYKVDTGIHFLDHMLELFCRHGLFDLEIKVKKSDLHLGLHHTNEDIGICLGQALNEALGKRKGIRRFGEKSVPMNGTLVRVVVDISGRPFVNSDWVERAFKTRDVESYNIDYAYQFFQALVNNFPITMHISILNPGRDMHHLLEAIFKAAGCALDEATRIDPRIKGVPSTKGRI